MTVRLISRTNDAEHIIGYCARVSNPSNQDNRDTEPKLLAYCIKHKHWSIFEMAHMCVEIKTSRAIAAQILRHRSFSFQEFSQRYQVVNADGYVPTKPRRQDAKNRQNSIDDLSQEDLDWFKTEQANLWDRAMSAYGNAINMGIAKECARMLLPLSTETTLYMVGSLRSWITYCQVRCDPSTQLEHRDIALEIQGIFKQEFPVIAQALDW